MIACRSPVEERPPSIFTVRGIGYGPRADSAAYSKETRVLRCFLPTTVIGIPIGAPSQSPEPRSAWTLPFAPIEPTISSEFAATGSVSTRWFHAFDFGKTGQRGVDGIFKALAVEPPSRSVPRHTKRTARLMVRLSTREAVRPRDRASPKGVEARRREKPSGTGTRARRPSRCRSPGASTYRAYPHALPRLGQQFNGSQLDVVARRVLCDADDPHELGADAGLLTHLTDGRRSTVSPFSMPPPGTTELYSGASGKSKTSNSSVPEAGC